MPKKKNSRRDDRAAANGGAPGDEKRSARIAREIESLDRRIAEEAPAPGSAPPSGVVPFASAPLSEATLRGLAQAGYVAMTPVQAAAIPHALAGRDVLGAARTGSGKTLAFLVPVLERLFRKRWNKLQDGPGGIVLSPTRELAGQIFQVLRRIGSHHNQLSVGLLVGGKRDFAREQQHVANTSILIATPGRLVQHFEQTPYFQADNLQILVLDEADRILDMGFRRQLISILDYVPKDRQTLLFSATQTKDVSHLATLSMNRSNIEYVGVRDREADADTPESLSQSVVIVPVQHKLNCVYSFLKTHLKCKTIAFFASCSQVRHAWELFRNLRPGLSVMALHGKLCQSKRTEVYDKFTQTPHAVLFATDVASRGLDFPNVDWVLQIDMPEDKDMYVHRAGRTARYKNKGNALLLLDPAEEHVVNEKWNHKLPLKKKAINPTKTAIVTQRAAALLAGDSKLHELGKKAFTSYVRSVALLPPQSSIRPTDLDLEAYATSLGLAAMPNLRFLEKITSREGLRNAKNVNRKLQKLKDQIKAEKLMKKIEKLKKKDPSVAAAALEASKKRKTEHDDDENDDDASTDGLLIVKSRQEPTSDAETDFDVPKVTHKPKRIRIEGSTSNVNKHTTFDDDGEAQPLTMSANDDDDAEPLSPDLAAASANYLDAVRARLEQNREQDRMEEKLRIREKHRKKKLERKPHDEDDEEDEQVLPVLGATDEVSSSEESSDGESESDSDSDGASETVDVAAQEALALSLIRGS